MDRATGQHATKRQVKSLAGRAAADIEEFYATRAQPDATAGDVLGISAGRKGIVMRPDALTPNPGPFSFEAKPRHGAG